MVSSANTPIPIIVYLNDTQYIHVALHVGALWFCQAEAEAESESEAEAEDPTKTLYTDKIQLIASILATFSVGIPCMI